MDDAAEIENLDRLLFAHEQLLVEECKRMVVELCQKIEKHVIQTPRTRDRTFAARVFATGWSHCSLHRQHVKYIVRFPDLLNDLHECRQFQLRDLAPDRERT